MLAALALSLAALAAPSELDAALADTPLSRGKAALAAKDVATAKKEFGDCIGAEAPNSEVGAACRWELGWALWLQGDWKGVVEQWEASKAVVPDREGIEQRQAVGVLDEDGSMGQRPRFVQVARR